MARRNRESETPIDPERARELLDQQAAELAVTETEPPKRKRGRPVGSKNRKKAEAVALEQAAQERQSEEDRQREIVELAAAIGATVGGAVDMWAPPAAALTDGERQRIGELWAPVLHPYMGALGAAAPWMMAIVGTAQIAIVKVKAVREADAETREQAGAEVTGE